MTAAIERITPRRIRTADGREIVVDLLVFATGFQAHNYMRPMNLRGRDGLSIDDAWAKGPRAYRMTAIPGFPNFFTVLGPNSPTGSISLQYFAELTARYITQWLRRFRDGEIETVEVTEEATTEFNDGIQRRCHRRARPDRLQHGLQFVVSHRRRKRRSVALRPQDHDGHARPPRRSRLPHHADRRSHLEGRWFVAFDDVLVVESPFGLDASLTVLFAGACAPGHRQPRGSFGRCGRCRNGCGGLAQRRKQLPTTRVGGVGLAAGCGPDEGAIR